MSALFKLCGLRGLGAACFGVTAVLAAASLPELVRRFGKKLPPRVHPLCDWPVPVLGGFLNLCVFLHFMTKVDKERIWSLRQRHRAKFGNVFRMPFITSSVVVVMGDEGVKLGQTLKDDAGRKVLGAQCLPSIRKIWGPFSLTVLELGPYRNRIKKAIHPSLAQKALESYIQWAEEEVEHWATRHLEERLHASDVLCLGEPFQEIAMLVPLRTVLGLGGKAREVAQRCRRLLVAMWGGTFAPPSRLFSKFDSAMQAREQFTPIVKELISQRREEMREGAATPKDGKTLDMLGQLIRARDDDGKALTDDEIVDSCVMVFLASYETTAAMLTVVLHHLAMPQHARIVDKLVEEQRSFGGSVSYAQLVQQMPFMAAVCKEALRIFPPVGIFFRSVQQEFQVQGFHVLPGYVYLMDLVGSQRDQVAEPDSFCPERFLDASLAAPLNRPYGFTPFGGGELGCPGKDFALMEGMLVLRKLMRSFHLEHADGDSRLRIEHGVCVRSTSQLKMKVRRRAEGDPHSFVDAGA